MNVAVTDVVKIAERATITGFGDLDSSVGAKTMVTASSTITLGYVYSEKERPRGRRKWYLPRLLLDAGHSQRHSIIGSILTN